MEKWFLVRILAQSLYLHLNVWWMEVKKRVSCALYKSQFPNSSLPPPTPTFLITAESQTPRIKPLIGRDRSREYWILAPDWSILFQEAAGGVWQARGRAQEAGSGPGVRRHRGGGRIQRGERPRGGHGAGLWPRGDRHLHPSRVHRGRGPQGARQGRRGNDDDDDDLFACLLHSLSRWLKRILSFLIDLCHFRCDCRLLSY